MQAQIVLNGSDELRAVSEELFDCFVSHQRNLTEYFVAVDVNNMLHLYASMLHERRIIITSSKLSTVSITSTSPRSAGRVHLNPNKRSCCIFHLEVSGIIRCP